QSADAPLLRFVQALAQRALSRREKPAAVRGWLISFCDMCGKLGVTSPTRLASISVVIPADLTAYLPSREVDRVDIAIGRIGRECRHQRVEIANRHALRCRPNDAHRHDRSAHCSAIERAGLRSRWRVSQIRA